MNELEKRKENVKEAIQQLNRRKESVRYDWDKFKELVSIELPEKPYDDDHIILVACTDTYDYTPLKYSNVFITDDSSYLKYFTNPFVTAVKLNAQQYRTISHTAITAARHFPRWFQINRRSFASSMSSAGLFRIFATVNTQNKIAGSITSRTSMTPVIGPCSKNK